jgi:hypothetical protein
MTAAGCLLEDSRENADFVVEARIGALGTDGHEVTYGIPANAGLAEAATLVPSAPPIPLIPEISVAKKEDLMGAAKVALFAYHRESRQPVWQSGVAIATNNAKDAWIFGAGPFQFGTIYEGTQFAGSRLQFPLLGKKKPPPEEQRDLVSYHDEVDFGTLERLQQPPAPLMPEEMDAELEALSQLPPLFPLTEQMIAGPEQPAPLIPPDAAPPAAEAPDVNAVEEPDEAVAERPEESVPRKLPPTEQR